MIGLLGFFLARPKLTLAVAALAVAAAMLAGAYFAGRGDGSEATTARVERQDQRAEDAGDEAKRAVRWCADTGRQWDVATGRCD